MSNIKINTINEITLVVSLKIKKSIINWSEGSRKVKNQKCLL